MSGHYVSHDPEGVQQHGHVTIGARHLLATGKHGPGSPHHQALRYLAQMPGATRAHDKAHRKAYELAHAAGQKFTHHSTAERDHTPGAHHHQLAAQYSAEIHKDNPPRWGGMFDKPAGPPPAPHYGESLFDRVCASSVIDEGFADKVKSFFSGGAEPAVHPNHPMKGFTAKRNKPRRSDTPAPSGPTPNHPAFHALAARTRAQSSRQPSPHVDPKAATQPLPHSAGPERVTKVSPTHPSHAVTTTRQNPALAATTHHDPATHHDPENVLATRHQPGTLQHTVHLFRQAKAIRSQVSRPVHVVQHGAKRYITTAPKHGAKILHTYESLGDAILRFRSIREQTSAMSVGPFMGSINGVPAVDVRSEGGKKKLKRGALIPLIRRSGPAAP